MKKLCLALACAALGFKAHANTIVFSTLGPSDSFDPHSFYAVVNQPNRFPFYIGARFIAEASGNLATVEFPLESHDFISFSNVPSIDVYLYGDRGDSPNTNDQTLLATSSLLVGPNFPTLFKLNVSGTVPVVAGTAYWFVLKPPGPDEFLMWDFSLPRISGVVDYTSNGSTWFRDPDDPLPAFRITATSAVLDSGSTAALFLVSTVILVAARRSSSAT